MCVSDRPLQERLNDLMALEDEQNAALKAKMDHLREVTALMAADVGDASGTGPTWHPDFSTFSWSAAPMGTRRTCGDGPPDYAHSTPRTDPEPRDGRDTPMDDLEGLYGYPFGPQYQQSPMLMEAKLPMPSRIAPPSQSTCSSNSERETVQNEATKSVHFKLADESMMTAAGAGGDGDGSDNDSSSSDSESDSDTVLNSTMDVGSDGDSHPNGHANETPTPTLEANNDAAPPP